jgi:hypothetical protein
LYDEITQRFVNLVNDLLRRISEAQTADFSHLPKSLEAEHGFRTCSRFFFHDMITIAQPASPLLYLIDYVVGDVHTNTIEGFWSLVKRGISGVYHNVGKQYLQSYLDEYGFRYNRRSKGNPIFNDFLQRVCERADSPRASIGSQTPLSEEAAF